MIVIDTSVAIPWLAPEEQTQAAEALLGRPDLAAPDLLLVESANVLRKKVRDGELVAEQAREGLSFLSENIGTWVPFGDVLARALEISMDVSHPVYDCVFVATAEALHGCVATRDGKLVDRLSETAYSGLTRLFPTDWAAELAP